MTYLVPRFPGGKRNHGKYQIWDGAVYDACIEPFAGGSAFSQQMLRRGCKNVFLGERDPLLLPIYECWLAPYTHQRVYDLIDSWKQRFLNAHYDRDRIDVVWECLKRRLDEREDYTKEEIAAASLVLRKLTFGGVVRLNTKDKLNVRYVECQIQLLEKWVYRFPYIDQEARVYLKPSWQQAMLRFKMWADRNPNGSAIALVDPPYYAELPTGEQMEKRKRQDGITPAYPGHLPHNLKTLALSVEPVEELLKFSQVERIVVTNYYSDRLDSALRKLDPGLRMRSVGRLDGLNQTRNAGTEYEECVWEMGTEYAKQTNLLELEHCLI